MTAHLRVFVSSVQKELEDERLIVQNLVNTDPLLAAHCTPVLYEFEPASPDRALDGCLRSPWGNMTSNLSLICHQVAVIYHRAPDRVPVRCRKRSAASPALCFSSDYRQNVGQTRQIAGIFRSSVGTCRTGSRLPNRHVVGRIRQPIVNRFAVIVNHEKAGKGEGGKGGHTSFAGAAAQQRCVLFIRPLWRDMSCRGQQESTDAVQPTTPRNSVRLPGFSRERIHR